MKRLSILVALLSSGFAWAKIDLPDPMPTVDRQTQYLLYLQTEIPSLFEQGAEYDIDFFNLIRQQDVLVSHLNIDQSWIRMAEARPALAEIQISLPSPNRSTELHFQAERLWAELRRNKIKAHPGDLKDHLDQTLLKGDASKLISGLMSLLSSDQQREGHKKSTLSEKIEFLRGVDMAAYEFGNKFKPERVGLKKMPRNWSEAIDWASDRYRAELHTASALFQICRETFSSTACEDVFGNNDNLWAVIIGGQELSREQHKGLETLRRNMLSLFSSKQSVTKSQEVDVIKLTEVPPYIGIFRGLVGADCSTSTSFPFVYMPGERTYFLYAPEGRLLGYLMGTLVRPGNSRNQHLYVHTISGPNLSRRHVELALYGLRSSAHDLDFTDVLLPTEDVAFRNINYVAIHGFLSDLRGSHSTPIRYVDGDIRTEFSTHPSTAGMFTGTYDSPEANPEAVELKDVRGEASNLKAVVRSYQPEEIHFDRRPNRSEAILIALDLLAAENSSAARNELREIVEDIRAHNLQTGQIDYASRRQAAAKILAPFNLQLPPSGRLAVFDSLSNSRSENLQEHYRRLQSQFVDLGLDLNAEMIEKRRSYLFVEGHLRAPDATTVSDSQLRKRTLQFVIYTLKRWAHPAVAYSVIRRNPEFFNESEKFMNFVESLFEGTEPEFRILTQLYDIGIDLARLNLKMLAENVSAHLSEGKTPPTDNPIAQIQEMLNALGINDCETPLTPIRRPR